MNTTRPSGVAPHLTGAALADRLRKIAISIRFFTPAERADLLGEAAARLEAQAPHPAPAALAREWHDEATRLREHPAEPTDPLVGLALDRAALQLSAGLARLAREIRSREAALHNGLDNRKHHPSYGYTKASLYETLNVLKGLLIAHMMAAAGWSQGGDPGIAAVEYAAAEFSIDLPGLARAIRES